MNYEEQVTRTKYAIWKRSRIDYVLFQRRVSLLVEFECPDTLYNDIGIIEDGQLQFHTNTHKSVCPTIRNCLKMCLLQLLKRISANVYR